MKPAPLTLKPPQRQRRFALVSLGLAAAIYAVVIVAGGAFGLRINLTPSEPLGIWRIVPLNREVRVGDVVFVCPPDNSTMREARARGYLRGGACKGGFAPLIKMVVALPGQRISVGREVEIDGVLLVNSHVAHVDGQGRRLPSAVGGPVPDGSVFLHSGYPGSFDSRYFGPLPMHEILGLSKPIHN
jgi:conjugative transfer signal peptidase TraF